MFQPNHFEGAFNLFILLGIRYIFLSYAIVSFVTLIKLGPFMKESVNYLFALSLSSDFINQIDS